MKRAFEIPKGDTVLVGRKKFKKANNNGEFISLLPLKAKSLSDGVIISSLVKVKQYKFNHWKILD